MTGIEGRSACILMCCFMLAPIFGNPVLALEKPRIAILHFHTEDLSDVKSKGFRTEFLARILDTKRFVIIEGAEIDDVEKKHRGTAPLKDVDAIEIGRSLRADKIVFGITGRASGKYIYKISVINVKNGTVESQGQAEEKEFDRFTSAVDEIIGVIIESIGPPDTPFISGVSKGEETITIRWNSVKRGEVYAVYRSTRETGRYDFLVKTKDTAYSDRHVDPGQKYWYRIYALNEDGPSDFSRAEYGYIPKPLAGYYLRTLVPGWAQIYAGEKGKGYMLLGAFAVGGAATVLSGIRYRHARDEYHALGPGATRNEFDRKYAAYRNSAYIFLGVGVITTSILVINLADSLLVTRKTYTTIVGNDEGIDSLPSMHMAYSPDSPRGGIVRFGATVRY